jgi:hypothetical protein
MDVVSYCSCQLQANRRRGKTGWRFARTPVMWSDPRGIAFYAGDLYVVDRALDAVIRLSPSPDTSDCF